MLQELRVGEQRYRAVWEVLEGASVTEVARRFGVSRQSVHAWLNRYAAEGGLGGLGDRSSRPHACPHQMSPATEARIVEIRRAHPAWGADRIGYQLQTGRDHPGAGADQYLSGAGPQRAGEPGAAEASSGGLSAVGAGPADGVVADGCGRRLPPRRRGGAEGGLGIDDNSRFAISATLVRRATAGPVCEALLAALRRHGVPDQILTDNGKVFTGRFGPAGSSAEVLFDRVCAENGIRHLLTAPRSPTTTGKVERWHKTIRAEFLAFHDRRHATVAELQQALDAWVAYYNTERPHQALGMRPPMERFQIAPAEGGYRRRASAEPASCRPAAGGGAVRPDRAAARGAAVGRPARFDLLRRVPLPGADRAGRGAGGGGGRGASGADLPP